MKARVALALLTIPLALLAQPRNLNFREGKLGWFVPPMVEDAGYSLDLRHDHCRTRDCAVLIAPEEPEPRDSGNLMQTFPADAYRGKTVRFSAWLRIESGDPFAHAAVWIRTAGETIGGPEVLSSDWTQSEVLYDVEPDATSISIGVIFSGEGRVWIDGIAFALPGVESNLAHLHPRDLNFREGGPGKSPPGWILNPAPRFPTRYGYRAGVVRAGCKKGPVCAVVTSYGSLPDRLFTSLMQTVTAGPYRGKFVRVRASIRLGATSFRDSAHLWVRIDNPGELQEPASVWFFDRRMQFCDERPPDWTVCDLTQRVDDEAESISFGVMIVGRGPVWIDGVSFDTSRELSRSAPATHVGDPVSKLIAQVRQDIGRHQSDGQLAKSLHNLKLSERLEDRVIEELENEGPQTVAEKSMAELLALRDATLTLPPPPGQLPFPSPPAPPIEEQRQIVNRAAEYAFRYASRLPDFMCTQTVRRSEDPEGKGWKLRDVLTVQVGYFDGTEHYRLASVNHRPTKISYESVRGASSQGEFGSMMAEIFRIGAAKFEFDHRTTLRKHPAYVFRYSIPASNSNYFLQFGETLAAPASTIVGQHGYVYLDRESARVLRIVRYADSIPLDFPITDASTTLDYDFFEVAGASYLLPIKADMRVNSSGVGRLNEIMFGDYRKFTGESKISFQ